MSFHEEEEVAESVLSSGRGEGDGSVSLNSFARTDEDFMSDVGIPGFPRKSASTSHRGQSAGRMRKKPPAPDEAAKENKTRARPRKPHEPGPFLSVDNLPMNKPNHKPDNNVKNSKSFTSDPATMSYHEEHMRVPYNTPHASRGPVAGSAGSRVSSDWNNMIPRQHKYGTPHPDLMSKNVQVQSPFKHDVKNKPHLPHRPVSPGTELKEKTIQATQYVARQLAKQKPATEKVVSGKLLKAKLKPLYPVRNEGPSLKHCRGVLAETRTHSASASRTLQRRRQIVKNMRMDGLPERPQTGESIHQTSIASDLSDNRLREIQPDLEHISHPRSQEETSTPASSQPMSSCSTPDIHGRKDEHDNVHLGSEEENPERTEECITNVQEEEESEAGTSLKTSSVRHSLLEQLVDEMEQEDDSWDMRLDLSTRPKTVNDPGLRKSVRFAEEDEILSSDPSRRVKSAAARVHDREHNGPKISKSVTRKKQTPNKCKPDEKETLEDDDNEDGDRSGKYSGNNEGSSKGRNSSVNSTNNTEGIDAGNHTGTNGGQENQQTSDNSVEAISHTERPKTGRGRWADPVKSGKERSNMSFKGLPSSVKSPYCPSNTRPRLRSAKQRTKPTLNSLPVHSQITAPKLPGRKVRPYSACPKRLSGQEQHKPYLKKVRPWSANHAIKMNTYDWTFSVESPENGTTPFLKRPEFPCRPLSGKKIRPLSGKLVASPVKSFTEDDHVHVSRGDPWFSITGSKMTQNVKTGICSQCKKLTSKIADYSEETGYLVCDVCDRKAKAEQSKLEKQDLENGNFDPLEEDVEVLEDEEDEEVLDDPLFEKEAEEEVLIKSDSEEETEDNLYKLQEKSEIVEKTEGTNVNNTGATTTDGTEDTTAYETEDTTVNETDGATADETDGTTADETKGATADETEGAISSLEHQNPTEEQRENALLSSLEDIDKTLDGVQQEIRKCIEQTRQSLELSQVIADEVEKKTEEQVEDESADTETKTDELACKTDPKQEELEDRITNNESEKVEGEQLDKEQTSDELFRKVCIDSGLEPGEISQILLDGKCVSRSKNLTYDMKVFHYEEDSVNPQQKTNVKERPWSGRKKPLAVQTGLSGQIQGQNPGLSVQGQSTGQATGQATGQSHGDISMYTVKMVNPGLGDYDLLEGPGQLEGSSSHLTQSDSHTQGSSTRGAFLADMCQMLPKSQPKVTEDKRNKVSSCQDDSPLEVKATATELNPRRKPEPATSSALAPFPPLCFRINARPPRGFLYYFAYGTDMNPNRLSTYVKRELEERQWGLLFGFRLVFNKKGVDEEAGGFPNLDFNPHASVEGCLYLITPQELELLDQCMGYPEHYEHIVLPVWLLNCDDPDTCGVAQYCVPALMYFAQDKWTAPGEQALSCTYAADQCRKNADLLTPAYREQLDKKMVNRPLNVKTALRAEDIMAMSNMIGQRNQEKLMTETQATVVQTVPEKSCYHHVGKEIENEVEKELENEVKKENESVVKNDTESEAKNNEGGAHQGAGPADLNENDGECQSHLSAYRSERDSIVLSKIHEVVADNIHEIYSPVAPQQYDNPQQRYSTKDADYTGEWSDVYSAGYVDELIVKADHSEAPHSLSNLDGQACTDSQKSNHFEEENSQHSLNAVGDSRAPLSTIEENVIKDDLLCKNDGNVNVAGAYEDEDEQAEDEMIYIDPSEIQTDPANDPLNLLVLGQPYKSNGSTGKNYSK